jgi:hypothetical protein
MSMEETALVPVKPARIQRKDKRGLRLNQKKALLALAQGLPLEECAEAAGVALTTLKEWTRDDPAFMAAYEDLWSSLLDDFKHRASTLLPQAGELMKEGLEAEQYVEADCQCPDCGHKFKTPVAIPAWNVRLRIMENIQKLHGLLGTTVKVEGKIEQVHTLELTTDDYIAIQRIKRGMEVPPDVYQSLRERGAIEGEFRELDSHDTGQTKSHYEQQNKCDTRS